MDNSIDGMAILEQNGLHTYLNEAHAKAYGYDDPEELLGKSWETLYDEEQLSWFERHLEPALQKEGHWRGEAVGLRRDGSTFPQEISVAAVKGGERVLVVRDITERKALEKQLEHQAFHDALTDLPNRVLFMDRLEHALVRLGKRNDRSVAVLFLDLDNFKLVNDSLGHEVGDRLLNGVARRLKGSLRPEDTVARLGGDEFAILLEDVAEESDAIHVTERIAEKLRSPFVLGGHEVFASPSIGIALGTSTSEVRPEDLLRAADLAMYQAKNAGKDYHLAVAPSTNGPALRRLKLERDLRWAIQREEFGVYYQPLIKLANETIVGMEALARWNHPRHGLISPDEFITLAEETGLIVQLGRWMLEEACRQARQWQEQHTIDESLQISVNLSAKQLQRPQLIEEVAQILQATKLDPACLVLEITESTLMEDILSATATLKKLKNLGVQLAIDDFGAGYSSLSFLKHFPVDVLKMDKSFIDGLRQDADEAAIVSGMIYIAHALGLKVVAEGIESMDQLAQLIAFGCDMGQGYLFAKPLPGYGARDRLLKGIYS